MREGSIIECENQTLGEALDIAGTPFRLHYQSERSPGRRTAHTLRIPLSGASVPDSLKRIELEISVAGQHFSRSFAATPRQAYTFVWDGRDSYGRALNGQQRISVKIGFVYPSVYQGPANVEQSFARFGDNTPITGSLDRQEVTIWQGWEETIGRLAMPDLGLGGWSLDVQHIYDPTGRVLYLGNSSRRSAEHLGAVVTTVAGNGQAASRGNRVPAREASLRYPRGMAVGPDGSLYIADTDNHMIRRVAPNGIITRVAGSTFRGYGGDGRLATLADLASPKDVDVGPDGSLYIADSGNNVIRRVAPNGIITTVAGDPNAWTPGTAFPTNSQEAIHAWLSRPEGVAVAPDGGFYIADTSYGLIRRVWPDGTIATVVGSTDPDALDADGIPARQADLSYPVDVLLGPDGSLYFAERHDNRIRRVGPDGIITTVAGTGAAGYNGDGIPATQAELAIAEDLAIGPDGSLYIADFGNARIRRVGPDGIITTVAGSGTVGYNGDGGLATATQLNYLRGVALGPDGSLYIADTFNHRIRRVVQSLPGFTLDEVAITSEDGRETYQFSAGGRHLRTLDALTGIPIYTFAYDGAGRLTQVTDRDGMVTRIERQGGKPTAIVGPYGQRTTLTVNADGYLASVANPAGETTRLGYTSGGLLTSLTGSRGGVHTFAYDSLGRLTQDTNPVGGFTRLSRAEGSHGYTVTIDNALGDTATLRVENLPNGDQRRTSTAPHGATITTLSKPDGTRVTTDARGNVTTVVVGPDPRWGMQEPFVRSVTRTTADGRTFYTMTASRAVTLANPTDPLSLQSQTDTVTVNGRTTTTIYDAATRAITTIDPSGLQTVTTLDARARPARAETANLAPIKYTYDTNGRLIAVVEGSGVGSRTTTTTYDAAGFPASSTDALNRTTSYSYDLAGRLLGETLPNGQALVYTYDAAGNRTSSTDAQGVRTSYEYDLQNRLIATTRDPGGQAVRTEYTYDLAGNLVAQIDDAGAGRLNATTRYSYTPIDGGVHYALSRMTDPLGRETSYTYTTAGQIDSVVDPLGNTTRLRYTAQGWRDQVTSPAGRTTTTEYNSEGQPVFMVDPAGSQRTTTYDAFGRPAWVIESTDAAVTQMLAYSYDANGRLLSTTIGAGTPLAQTMTSGYDMFGRVISATVGLGTAHERTDVTRYNPDDTIAETIQNYRDGSFDADHPDEDVSTTYGYDQLGRQVWTRDVLGRYDVTHYDAAGRMDWSARNLVPFAPDSQGQPVFQAFDPAQPDANVATLYGYDSLGRTILVTETGILAGAFDPATRSFSASTSRVTRTEYDKLGRPILVTHNYQPGQPAGPDVNVQTAAHYDDAGQLTWQRDALGRWTHIEYDALSRPVTVTLNYENGNPLTVEPANRTWTDGSDSDLISVTRYTADGQVDRQIANYLDGEFTATEPIADRITLFGYDSAGRPTTTTLNSAPGLADPALNRTSAVSYDPLTNRVAGQQDALGRWTSQQYDALGRVTATVRNCRDDQGRPVPQGCAPFDPGAPDRNVSTQLHFDPQGRLVETIDALGQRTQTAYDGLSRPIAATQNARPGEPSTADTNVTTRVTYDALGRVALVTDAVGAETQYAYDALGRTSATTDPAGRVTRMGYDATGALRWLQRADGQLTVDQLDGLGRVIATIQNYRDGIVAPDEPDDQDLIARTSYDAGGRRVQTVDALGRVTAFGYDLSNRLVLVQENVIAGGCAGLPAHFQPCNVTTRYAYDRAGNRVAIVDARGSLRRFAFDAADQQTAATDPLGRTTSWEYDALGNIRAQRDPRGSTHDITFGYDELDRQAQLASPTVGTITASYDALGRRQRLTDPTGTTTFAYDALGRLTSVAAPATGTVEYGYNARGDRTQLTYPDGARLDYDYAADGRLRAVREGAETLASYDYDAAGHVARVTRANGAATTYAYDGADRVREISTLANGVQISRFEYQVNALGLRAQAIETLGGQSRTVTYSYDGLLRLVGATESPGATYAYGYDLAGNRTDVWQDGALLAHHNYDAADQVVGWQYDDAGNLLDDGTTSYSYDALNRLIETTEGGVTTASSYNGVNLLIAQTAGGSTTRYAQDLAAPLSQALQTSRDGATTSYRYGLERLAAVGTGGRTWDLADALGSVRATLDDTGAPLTTANYDPWGTPEGGAQPGPFGFTGELHDPTSGLVYLRARWYHAGHGTFTSRDSFPGFAAQPASLHAYQYGYNNPAYYTDPSGHCPICIPILIGMAIGGALDYGSQVYRNYQYQQNGHSDIDIWKDICWREVGIATFAGGVAGLTSGLLAPALGGLAQAGFWGSVGAGMIDGAFAGFTSKVATNAFTGRPLDEGLLEAMAFGGGAGAFFGGVFGKLRMWRQARAAGVAAQEAAQEAAAAARAKAARILRQAAQERAAAIRAARASAHRAEVRAAAARLRIARVARAQVAAAARAEANRPKDVVAFGHGKWEFGGISIRLGRPIGSFTTLGEGQSVTLYGEVSERLTDELGHAIAYSVQTNSSEVLSGVYSKTYGPGSEVPDLTLFPPESPPIRVPKGTLTVDKPTYLSELLSATEGPVNLHWAACLACSMGRQSGIIRGVIWRNISEEATEAMDKWRWENLSPFE